MCSIIKRINTLLKLNINNKSNNKSNNNITIKDSIIGNNNKNNKIK